MRNLVKIPLIFFFIASLIGLVLRWHLYQPLAWMKYPYWLHAHSHIMFLGWIFNALTIFFVLHFVPNDVQRRYVTLIVLINVLLTGMLIAFPLQGYGLYSIAISTLHTVLVALFIVRFFRQTGNQLTSEPVAFARLSLVFFLISAIGPFTLGALVAKGLGQTQWYHLAVYYYLHFQYNGVFTFGVFALFYRLLETKGVAFSKPSARLFRLLLFSSCFPAYALSALWTNPGWILYAIGWVAALMQLMAFVFFIQSVKSSMQQILLQLSVPSRILLGTAFLAFALKLVLQLLSALPSVAALAYEVRSYVIGYLHLVLIGMVSLFLLAWYHQQGFIELKWHTVTLLLLGFAGSELCMIGVGYAPLNQLSICLVITTLVLVTGIGSVVVRGLMTRTQRSA